MDQGHTAIERDVAASVGWVDMKLEVVVFPVSNVDRAKRFYTSLGWQLDVDFTKDELRGVQFTPPDSRAPSTSARGSRRPCRARRAASFSSCPTSRRHTRPSLRAVSTSASRSIAELGSRPQAASTRCGAATPRTPPSGIRTASERRKQSPAAAGAYVNPAEPSGWGR